MDGIWISGFADEISSDFDEQLATVTGLGMKYISLRSADGKNVADYTPEEVEEQLLPRLKAAGVGVSSLGSPIGKQDQYAAAFGGLNFIRFHPDGEVSVSGFGGAFE